MPIRLKPGAKKTGSRGEYEIVRHLNDGMFATAYEAKTAAGRKVFFKEYKSPTPTVAWFESYVKYQQDLKGRIEGDPTTRSRCYEFLDFFVDRFFYQVFQFIEGGESLEQFLARTQDNLDEHWDERVDFSRTMMYALAGLHKAQVVHTDLKPDNLYLLPHPTLPGKRWLRVIDMDFSILADKKAPWDGINGYVGTPRYQSPEHLTGKVPIPASDVFTLGLILGELLTGSHPFVGVEDYEAAAKEGSSHEPITVHGSIKNVASKDFLEDVLNACLNPTPKDRPTAQQVAEALMGKEFELPTARVRPRPIVRDAKPEKHGLDSHDVKLHHPETGPSVGKVSTAFVELWLDGRCITRVSTNSEIGRYTFKGIHDDYQFLPSSQFKLFRAATSGAWMIEHCNGATNETIVDGHPLTAPIEIADGMHVAVGNSKKKIEKLPLTIYLGKS